MSTLVAILLMCAAAGALVVYLLTSDQFALVVCVLLGLALASESDGGRA